LTLHGKGTGEGEIKGRWLFDRKEYRMNSGIPFIKVADRVEVSVNSKVKTVSGPPVVFHQLAWVGDLRLPLQNRRVSLRANRPL
jgi:hypothetical protein